MKRRYPLSEIPLISAPVTSANFRNTRNHPAIELGNCTPFQLLSSAGISHDGMVCMIGDPSRGIGITKALIRRERKPFLLLGASNRDSLYYSLTPDWTKDTAQLSLPTGNGAILFSDPFSSYLELCEYLKRWAQNYFLILHLGNGLQIGVEVLDRLCSLGQCLLICDSIPQSLRESEARVVSPVEFMKKMRYLFVSSIGSSSKELVELLPTYQYEKISNTVSFNTYKGGPILPSLFRGHRGQGISVSQTRTTDFKKSIYETDDLKKLFDDGYMLIYNEEMDSVYLALVG